MLANFTPKQVSSLHKQYVNKYKPILCFFLVFVIALPVLSVNAQTTLSTAQITNDYKIAQKQINKTLKQIPRNRYPINTNKSGNWVTTDASGWTSGFYPGILWLLYEQTGNKDFLTKAANLQSGLINQQFNKATHDIGFIIFNSFGNGYRTTNKASYKKVINQTAKTLAARYNPKIGMIRSWNIDPKSYQVIIDNLMNLEILFWSARNGGDQRLFEIAKAHAKKTANDFVRPDGSTYHLVNYNLKTGKILSRTTAQGYSTTSTWSRGQTWAIYGFAIAYRETKDDSLLKAARKTADYFINHLPTDNVPYWDFDVPNKQKEPRDSSAAAIAASGLLELSRLETSATRKQTYLESAKKIIASLSSSEYLVANQNQNGILLHGTYDRKAGNYDQSTIWGDYYFLEALLKLK